MFRIEDTDAGRDSEESYEQILDSLRWLGMDWDEGVEVGGPHGPYRQSERKEIYQDVIQKLIESGHAYESYSTPQEIQERHRAAGRNPNLGYDGYDRELTEEQVAEYRAQGREPVLRLRMPDEAISFTDMVRGPITFEPGSVPDFVIVRANGDPLYTLVNPVDDALMEITHVLRGEDLLSSTPRQIALYRALMDVGVAKQIPEFGHLPYVMGEGNKKLSKRDPESNLLLHREKGMIPEGLLNYLALLGWAISPDEDIFTMDQMIQAFDIADVNANPARFDAKKSLAINGDHIRMLEAEDFRDRLVPFLYAEGIVSANSWDGLTDREKDILAQGAPLVQTRMQLLGEAPDLLGSLFDTADAVEIQEDARRTLREGADEVLDRAIQVVQEIPEDEFTSGLLQDRLRVAIVEQMGVKPRLAFGPLRVALSGRRVSPPLFESMVILGKTKTLARLESLRSEL